MTPIRLSEENVKITVSGSNPLYIPILKSLGAVIDDDGTVFMVPQPPTVRYVPMTITFAGSPPIPMELRIDRGADMRYTDREFLLSTEWRFKC